MAQKEFVDLPIEDGMMVFSLANCTSLPEAICNIHNMGNVGKTMPETSHDWEW